MESWRELFEANLSLIDRAIERVCAKARLAGADAEDFASDVRLALMADDYAILRQWERRSALGTYLTVVVQRLLNDHRRRRFGKWRPTAEAERAGEVGIRLEMLVRRDGRSLDEALPLLQKLDSSLTRDALAAMMARFPERTPRPRAVDLDASAFDVADVRSGSDAAARELDARRTSGRASAAMRAAIDALPEEDQLLVRFHFADGMTVADVSRVLGIPQRPLYRRLEAVLRELRRKLLAAAVDAAAIEELIGSPLHELDFGLSRKSAGGVPSHEEKAR